MTTPSRDVIVLSDMVGSLIVKIDFLSDEEAHDLALDIERWRGNLRDLFGDDGPADRLLDAIHRYIVESR